MTNTVMLSIEFLRIDASKLPHSSREIGIGSFNQQVVVVVHQAVAVATPIIPLDKIAKDCKEHRPV